MHASRCCVFRYANYARRYGPCRPGSRRPGHLCAGSSCAKPATRFSAAHRRVSGQKEGGVILLTIEPYGVNSMARSVKDLEREIRELGSEEKLELIRGLIAELDSPADANVERAWLETSQRRYRELVEGKVQGVPGPLIFERLRKRLGR